MTSTDFAPEAKPGSAVPGPQSVVSAILALLGIAGRALRTTAFALLAVLEPVVCAALTAIVWIAVGLLLFHGLVHLPHFRVAPVLGIALTAGLALVGYYALLNSLRPG